MQSFCQRPPSEPPSMLLLLLVMSPKRFFLISRLKLNLLVTNYAACTLNTLSPEFQEADTRAESFKGFPEIPASVCVSAVLGRAGFLKFIQNKPPNWHLYPHVTTGNSWNKLQPCKVLIGNLQGVDARQPEPEEMLQRSNISGWFSLNMNQNGQL